MKPWRFVVGGAIVSPKGQMIHTVEGAVEGEVWTICGIHITPWMGWGRPGRRLESYRHCQRCSLYGRAA